MLDKEKSGKLPVFVDKFFSHSLDVRVQSFNLLVITGIISMISIAIINAVTHAANTLIFIDLASAAFMIALLYITEKKKCYRASGFIIVMMVFCVAFPALFFYRAGNRGGMVSFFILAIIFTYMLLEGRDKIIAIAIEAVIYVSCFEINYLNPGLAHMFDSELDFLVDELLGFTISCILIFLTILLRDRIIKIERERISRLNQELKDQNEALAQYDSMKSDFLATVAHEIKTPLAVISASSNDTIDLLGETPLNIEFVAEDQQIIIKRVKLIDDILMDLMDTVAIERGRLILKCQLVNLSELIVQISDLQFKKLNTNNNRLNYDIQPDLPPVYADPTRIEQVLNNLLSNAVYHTRDGIITVKLEQSGGNQIVSVSDTGEGIDDEMARIILREYTSTKEDYWRHGIGLYLCRRIISAHGGDIQIESEKGFGTTISFTLNGESENGEPESANPDS